MTFDRVQESNSCLLLFYLFTPKKQSLLNKICMKVNKWEKMVLNRIDRSLEAQFI